MSEISKMQASNSEVKVTDDQYNYLLSVNEEMKKMNQTLKWLENNHAVVRFIKPKKYEIPRVQVQIPKRPFFEAKGLIETVQKYKELLDKSDKGDT